MNSEANNVKIKSQKSENPYSGHFPTYQGEPIRKSID